jgi:predicted CXXCH cytochrome family protein
VRIGFNGLAWLVSMLLVGSMAYAECLTGGCHSNLVAWPYPHAPVEDGDCLACHAAVTPTHPVSGEKSFKLTAEGAELCAPCHDPFGKRKSVHAPVRAGECLSCHQVHGADQPNLLAVGDNLSELCFGCHDKEPFRQASQHGPAAAGSCTGCHDPHVAPEKTLLKKPLRTLCLECHADFASQLQAAPVVHDPVKTAPCTSCHDPHGASAAFVLKEKMPELCFRCHKQVKEKLAKVKVGHEPLQASGSCGNCHSTHFSNANGLLPADEKTVCLRCHSTDQLGNPPLKNIGKELATQKKTKAAVQQHLHGPLQENRCSGCHDPHGSNNFRILTGNYPEGIYAPYEENLYDFCLQCHDRNLLRFKETSLYTRFRNGKQNLHFVHVVNKQKGRTCRLCHESHVSNAEKLISEEGTRFGNWRIQMRFKSTENGGSCAPGCHQALGYDRENPVKY